MNLDGISMVPTLLGHPDEQPLHEAMYWEFSERGRSQAARMGNWKGVRLNLKQNPDAPIELYDLDADIGEQRDVAAQQPAIIRRIATYLQSAREPSDNWPIRELPRSRPPTKKAEQSKFEK